MHLDEKAQLSMDFLGGFVIVFFSLITVMIFLPVLFSTAQNPSVELHPVAYRAGVLLAEDMGWWRNSTTGNEGSDWEDHLSNTTRIGLVSLKYGKGDPAMLNKNKTLSFIELYNRSDPAAYENVQNLLGLKTAMRKYDYNITFKTLHGDLWLLNVNNQEVKMTFGKEIPDRGNVEKVVRVFKIKKGDFFLDVPSINPPGVMNTWWPDWPLGHIYDDPAPNGQFDRPIQLFTPVYDFTVYDMEPLFNNVIKFDMYITNDPALDENNDLQNPSKRVVQFQKNFNAPWTVSGTAYDGSTWVWSNDSGKYYYDFGSYIQGKVAEQGWTEQTIYMTIVVQNLKGNVTSSSFTTYTPMTDPWLLATTFRPSVEMEVCVW